MNTQETEQALVTYIKEKYNPLAIILHGSRANGNARPHSDWDIVLIADHEIDAHREMVGDANVEYVRIVLPVREGKFLGFYFRTENTKILFDTDGIAEKMITQNDILVRKGNPMTERGQYNRSVYFHSCLDGMLDYADSPLSMFDKKIDFYTRIVMTWYSLKKGEYQPSGYISYPTIEKEDPELYQLMNEFVASDKAEDLIRIGRDIVSHFFPKIATK